jgi:hypothetical protein
MEESPKKYIYVLIISVWAKKKMEKNKIVKSWELKATSQKSFYKKAYEKQQELADLCSEYNNLAVGNIKNIYKDKHIFPNMEI